MKACLSPAANFCYLSAASSPPGNPLRNLRSQGLWRSAIASDIVIRGLPDEDGQQFSNPLYFDWPYF